MSVDSENNTPSEREDQNGSIAANGQSTEPQKIESEIEERSEPKPESEENGHASEESEQTDEGNEKPDEIKEEPLQDDQPASQLGEKVVSETDSVELSVTTEVVNTVDPTPSEGVLAEVAAVAIATEAQDSSETEKESGSAVPSSATDAPVITVESSPATGRTSTTASVDSSRRSYAAKVDNSHIFKRTFEFILTSKEAKKNDKLKTATQNAIDSLNNSASRDPHVLFEALKLACETLNDDLRCKAVDLFAKLFDYALFDDEEDRVQLTDAAVNVVYNCFEGEGTDPELEMQVVRALMHSILLMPTHGASLLKAVRQIYNVFIFSLTPRNQAVAQGTLTQVIGTIFLRVSESILSRSRMSKSNSNINLKDEPGQTEVAKDKVTLDQLQISDSADSARVDDANHASEKDEDLAVKDAFLIFRAMCKISVKDLNTDSVDMKSHSVRSKLLSLHIIHTILKNNIDIFLSKDVVILSSSSDDETRLIDTVRNYLCQTLIQNAASPLAPIFEVTLEIFWIMISNLRSDFKMEIPVFWEQIYFPVGEIKTSTPHQKRYLLSVIERLCNDSRCIIEFYLNYDCDSNQPNICEKVIDYLTRLSLARVDVTPAQKAAYRENKRKGISLYDIGRIANLTSSTMNSRPPEPDVYNSFPLEYAMKMTSLNCSVAFLRSLYSWAQKGISKRHSLSNGSGNGYSKLSLSDSASSSRNNSRNPSFIGHQAVAIRADETDDPEQFENLKQRKKAFLEGVRQFNVKPKKGIAYFIDNKFINSSSPQDIASFLLTSDTLDKAAIGEYLGEGDDKNIAIMHAFVDLMDFYDTTFVEAMRNLLQSFRLPGEAQKIDRFMLKFAERYVLGNPNVFSNAGTAYVLAYSVILLNTDLHSSKIKNKMTVDDFVRNNSGIDDGNDISRDLLESVYNEIQNNEIKLQSEQHAALLAGDQSVLSPGPSGFFGGRDLNKEAYNHASREMSTKTEKLVKSLGKKSKSEDSHNVFYAASNVHHVKSIFDTLWMSILAGLTAPFKEFDEGDVTRVCLEGIKLSIKISCMFELQYAKKSFIRALVQFQNLHNIEDIREKNIEAIYVMLEIAVSEGNAIQKSWIDVLTSISQLERLQLIAQGVDQNSIPDVSTAKLVSRNSLESVAAPTGLFSLFRETASQSAATKFHNQHLSAEAAQALGRTELSVAMDRVFTNSSDLSGEAIMDFVEALSQVATEEIDSSGLSSNPRMFSLQKVVDICYYNMSRIRLEWSQLWAIMGKFFNEVGCNPNLTVDFFALDSLRQLSMRFLNIDELSHFKFQKEFLKPFEHIATHNDNVDVKDMVLECINNMILAKAANIKSGWKTIFGVLTAAAKEKKDGLVMKAYKLAFSISRDYNEEVTEQDSFADLVACFTAFAKNEKFQKVGLLSLEVLSKLIVHVAKVTIETGSDTAISVKGQENNERYETLNRLWFPILFGFYDIIMTGEELEVRSRTLTHFFDVLLKYGSHFEADFWDLIYHKLLAPIFGVLDSPWGLKYDDELKQSASAAERERMSFWVSTTLIQALNSLVSLFTHYFDALRPMLGEFLELLIHCICQENDTIARTGKSCLQDFLIQNAEKFDEAQWTMISGAFERLFILTRAEELFQLDPLREQSDVDSLDINESQSPPDEPVTPTRDGDENSRAQKPKDKSSIVVKCVLQLLMIETVLELSMRDSFYDAIPNKFLMQLANHLHESYQFAKTFNDDYDLRVRLWNSGVIERLPNLLKQESMSSAVFLNIMFRLYCDSSKANTREVKEAMMESVIPLCDSIVKRYCEFDETNQQKSISTWRPVIIEIFQGYVEFDDTDFERHSPRMYQLTLRLFDRGLSVELRKAIQMFMARIGDTFVYKS